MKFKTHNQTEINAIGTHLQGYIEEEYKTLKKVFGRPNNGDGYKVDAEWVILFENSDVATIYNYKTGRNYNGRAGTPKTRINHWHVGGNCLNVIEFIKQAIKSHASSKEPNN